MTAATTESLLTLGGTRRVYVLPELRLLFVSVAKNACTSIKWGLAELGGEDLSTFALNGLSYRMHAEHAIHDRRKWRHVKVLTDLSPEVRSDIHPDNGWFIFALTRDPRSRLFSAWEQKFMLWDPAYARYLTKPWHPRLPASPEVIAEDFARFVDSLDSGPARRLKNRDSHFSDQTKLLRSDLVPYTRIYDVREMGDLTRDLNAHLAANGHAGKFLMRRSNDTPLRANALVYPDDVRAKVERIYAKDFAAIDAGWNVDTILSAPAWSEEALRDAFARAELGKRAAEIRAIALQQREQVTILRTRVAKLEARLGRSGQPRLAKAGRQPASKPLSKRVSAKLRRLRARLR